MSRHVKGSLFVDYVRMLKARKEVPWSERLAPEDLPYLSMRIEKDAWYPMETFERMGLAILNVVAEGDVEAVRFFGQASVDWLAAQYPGLLAPGDPRESLMRFHVVRRSFFDYPALDVRQIGDGTATIKIDYQMGDVAEEAASFQTMGFFERLLEFADAREIKAWFASKRWEGDAATLLELRWTQPA